MSLRCMFGRHSWPAFPDWFDGAGREVFECQRGCHALQRREPTTDWAIVTRIADNVTTLATSLCLREGQRNRLRSIAWDLRKLAGELRAEEDARMTSTKALLDGES